MPTVKIIKSDSARNLDDYLKREKPGSDLPRVLHVYGQRCRPETAKAEFKALRVEHGQQNAMRTVPAKYVEPGDPRAGGAEPTHIKIGKNWRAAKAGEAATHVRIEPEVAQVKRSEVNHIVVSFGLHEVNPDDPEATQRAFEWVAAHWAKERPGVQAKFVAHGDATGSQRAIEQGEGGKFHVHVMENCTIHSAMELEGRSYEPGMRTAGPLTDIDRMRERSDLLLDTDGAAYGLGPQVLPAPRSPEAKAVRHTQHDHHSRERGEVSDQDYTRWAVETGLENLAQDPATVARLSVSERKALLAEQVRTSSGIRLKLARRKDGTVRLRSYELPDRAKPLTGKQLGERYSDQGLGGQLELVAQGEWQPYRRPMAGPAKKIEALGAKAVTELQSKVHEMAATEAAEQAVEQAAAAEYAAAASTPGHPVRSELIKRAHREIADPDAVLTTDAELYALAVVDSAGPLDRDAMRSEGLSEDLIAHVGQAREEIDNGATALSADEARVLEAVRTHWASTPTPATTPVPTSPEPAPEPAAAPAAAPAPAPEPKPDPLAGLTHEQRLALLKVKWVGDEKYGQWLGDIAAMRTAGMEMPTALALNSWFETDTGRAAFDADQARIAQEATLETLRTAFDALGGRLADFVSAADDSEKFIEAAREGAPPVRVTMRGYWSLVLKNHDLIAQRVSERSVDDQVEILKEGIAVIGRQLEQGLEFQRQAERQLGG